MSTCEEIKKCLHAEGLMIGGLIDQRLLLPTVTTDAPNAFDLTQYNQTATFFVASSVTGAGVIPSTYAGFVIDVVELGNESIQWHQEQGLAYQMDYRNETGTNGFYFNYASEKDKKLESQEITRPRIDSPYLRGWIYWQSAVASAIGGAPTEENLKAFIEIVSLYGEAGDHLGETLATSPYLYPMMLQSEGNKSDDNFNDFIAENPELIPYFATAPASSEMMYGITTSDDVQYAFTSQLLGAENQEVQAFVDTMVRNSILRLQESNADKVTDVVNEKVPSSDDIPYGHSTSGVEKEVFVLREEITRLDQMIEDIHRSTSRRISSLESQIRNLSPRNRRLLPEDLERGGPPSSYTGSEVW